MGWSIGASISALIFVVFAHLTDVTTSLWWPFKVSAIYDKKIAKTEKANFETKNKIGEHVAVLSSFFFKEDWLTMVVVALLLLPGYTELTVVLLLFVVVVVMV